MVFEWRNFVVHPSSYSTSTLIYLFIHVHLPKLITQFCPTNESFKTKRGRFCLFGIFFKEMFVSLVLFRKLKNIQNLIFLSTFAYQPIIVITKQFSICSTILSFSFFGSFIFPQHSRSQPLFDVDFPSVLRNKATTMENSQNE